MADEVNKGAVLQSFNEWAAKKPNLNAGVVQEYRAYVQDLKDPTTLQTVDRFVEERIKKTEADLKNLNGGDPDYNSKKQQYENSIKSYKGFLAELGSQEGKSEDKKDYPKPEGRTLGGWFSDNAGPLAIAAIAGVVISALSGGWLTGIIAGIVALFLTATLMGGEGTGFGGNLFAAPNTPAKQKENQPQTGHTTEQGVGEQPKQETNEPKTETREPKTEPKEPKTEPKEPKTETKEPKTETKEPKKEAEKDLARTIINADASFNEGTHTLKDGGKLTIDKEGNFSYQEANSDKQSALVIKGTIEGDPLKFSPLSFLKVAKVNSVQAVDDKGQPIGPEQTVEGKVVPATVNLQVDELSKLFSKEERGKALETGTQIAAAEAAAFRKGTLEAPAVPYNGKVAAQDSNGQELGDQFVQLKDGVVLQLVKQGGQLTPTAAFVKNADGQVDRDKNKQSLIREDIDYGKYAGMFKNNNGVLEIGDTKGLLSDIEAAATKRQKENAAWEKTHRLSTLHNMPEVRITHQAQNDTNNKGIGKPVDVEFDITSVVGGQEKIHRVNARLTPTGFKKDAPDAQNVKGMLTITASVEVDKNGKVIGEPKRDLHNTNGMEVDIIRDTQKGHFVLKPGALQNEGAKKLFTTHGLHDKGAPGYQSASLAPNATLETLAQGYKEGKFNDIPLASNNALPNKQVDPTKKDLGNIV